MAISNAWTWIFLFLFELLLPTVLLHLSLHLLFRHQADTVPGLIEQPASLPVHCLTIKGTTCLTLPKRFKSTANEVHCHSHCHRPSPGSARVARGTLHVSQLGFPLLLLVSSGSSRRQSQNPAWLPLPMTTMMKSVFAIFSDFCFLLAKGFLPLYLYLHPSWTVCWNSENLSGDYR